MNTEKFDHQQQIASRGQRVEFLHSDMCGVIDEISYEPIPGWTYLIKRADAKYAWLRGNEFIINDEPTMKDSRTPALAAMRASIDRLNAEVTATQHAWPERYPVPPEVDALIEYRDDVVRRARSGDLRIPAKEPAL